MTAARSPAQPDTPQLWVVQNCSDAAQGSLRDIIENPINAQSGDIVDLSQLPSLCGSAASTITLTTGAITVTQDSLTLMGPAADTGSVTISAGNSSRVLHHAGAGLLTLDRLTIANGYDHAATNTYGGCIEQNGAAGGGLYLLESSVTACKAASDSGYARGGGIHALGNVFLIMSTISDSQAIAPAKRGMGGGIQANQLFAQDSILAGNVAQSGQGGGGLGGGAYLQAGGQLFGSTVSGNSAGYGAIAVRGTAYIVNSTISGNAADISAAAVYARGTDLLKIWNSTIAFNHAGAGTPYGAVTLNGNVGSLFDFRSSIIANNTSGPNADESDLFLLSGQGTLSGSSNLVMTSNVSPAGVIALTTDPMLGQLQANGGRTLTHLPMEGSPVLGAGTNPGVPNEQRGPGYKRTTGSSTDIGAVQRDNLFVGLFD
jgi:hypothetical protein